MKHIIEFNLPDDNEELKTTMNATKYYLALWDFSQKLREWRKYEDLETIEIDKLNDAFYEIMKEHGVEL